MSGWATRCVELGRPTRPLTQLSNSSFVAPASFRHYFLGCGTMEGEDRYHLALDFTNNEERDRDRLLSTCAANLSLCPQQLPLYRIVFASCEKIHCYVFPLIQSHF